MIGEASRAALLGWLAALAVALSAGCARTHEAEVAGPAPAPVDPDPGPAAAPAPKQAGVSGLPEGWESWSSEAEMAAMAQLKDEERPLPTLPGAEALPPLVKAWSSPDGQGSVLWVTYLDPPTAAAALRPTDADLAGNARASLRERQEAGEQLVVNRVEVASVGDAKCVIIDTSKPDGSRTAVVWADGGTTVIQATAAHRNDWPDVERALHAVLRAAL